MNYIRNTRLRIEKFIYKKGTNVALYNVEHSKRYKNFQKLVYAALYKQIKTIANYKDTLPLLVSLAKAQGIREELLSQVSVLVNTNTIANSIDLKAYLVWAGTQGGQAGLDKLGIDGIFGLKDQKLIDYFQDHSNLVITQVDDYTKEWIARKIQEGKDAGMTPFEIQQLLKDDGKAISDIRAERIVLTETASAMNVIEIAAARNNNIEQKIWRTSIDDRVCPICQDIETGEAVPIDQTFVGGYDTPPAHVSCRCYIEWVIPDGWTLPDSIWVG
jgi:SPP1 gp7 family putative phage head morphogenesis protein